MAGETEAMLGGGLSGAATGATVGSVVPGIGTGIGAAAGGVIGALGGLFSARKASKDANEQKRLLQQAMNMFNSIQTPEERGIVMEELKAQGVIEPELEQDILVGDTELRKISLDPRYKEAQIAALTQLQNLGKSGGLDEVDKANLEAAQMRARSEAQGQREQTAEEMARRGMSSSGLSMVQSQMAGQSAANAQRMADLQIQGEARRRALEAMMKGGQLAGDIRGQEFGEESQKAQAQDIINKFNVSNQLGVQSRNVAARNAAQEANLREQQRLADYNAQRAYTQAQQGFQNQMSRASGVAGQTAPMASFYGQQAQGTRDQWGNLLSAGAKGASAYADYKKANPDKVETSPTAAPVVAEEPYKEFIPGNVPYTYKGPR